MKFLILFLFCFFPFVSFAQEVEAPQRDLPRFVSLASEKVFVRAGPGLRYPIKWIFQKEGLPVLIIQEFDTWRKIRDISGDEGWIHQSLLRGKRNVIIESDDIVSILNKPDLEKGKEMARLQPNVVASLQECDEMRAWCKISTEGYAGWISADSLWGLKVE